MGLINSSFFEKAYSELSTGNYVNLNSLMQTINMYLRNYNELTSSELKFIRDFIIWIEPYIINQYPVVPYNLVADKIMIIADTHLGCKEETIGKLYEAYDVAEEQNIDTILLAGDIFDGFISTEKKELSHMECVRRYEYFKDRAAAFPSKKNIRTLSLIGNHDLSIIYDKHFSMNDLIYLFNSMPNNELLGIGKVYFNWNGINTQQSCRFILNHDISTLTIQEHTYPREQIILSGHHHYLNLTNPSSIILPSLSNSKRNGGLCHCPLYTIMEFKNGNIEISTNNEKIEQLGIELVHKRTLHL